MLIVAVDVVMLRLARIVSLIVVASVLSGCLSSRQAPQGSESRPPVSQGLSGAGLPARAQQVASDAEYQALQFGRVGQPVPWSSGNASGQVVPTQLYRVGSQDCRGFTHTITTGSETVRHVGSACRSGDEWTPVA
ncbi:hypothetical protein FPY71_11470 [Aureimonas fodinaquatilis]|uniref:Surface antigen domain-containing protein n=1 Tax=Aureimonas fodinaquatilis TaxID=2565783 RepID=A0A5B0DW50_9HYPH|nr:hypothetical protein [Aureimonas fodinaquatilis]KAA0971057.1 hypothetical protein FPY71_11470 [Aureimonas fodinaquatilis]